MVNALAHLQAASDTISRVRAAADQLHDDLQRLANDWDYTPEAKQRRMAPLLQRKAELQQELTAARGRLDRAERDAARQLRDAGAADLAQQTRTSRAARRVTQLLATVRVIDAAKMLALDEDVDGLRALREALPAPLAVQASKAGPSRWTSTGWPSTSTRSPCRWSSASSRTPCWPAPN